MKRTLKQMIAEAKTEQQIEAVVREAIRRTRDRVKWSTATILTIELEVGWDSKSGT